jgi:hypothetical protein
MGQINEPGDVNNLRLGAFVRPSAANLHATDTSALEHRLQQWMHFRRLGCALALAARWQQRFPVETFRLDEKG